MASHLKLSRTREVFRHTTLTCRSAPTFAGGP